MISPANLVLTVILTVALAAGSATAQDAEEPPVTELEEVVVEGRRLREAVDQFVDDIVAPPVGRGPARWHENICVGVANLRREAAQVVADQVSAVAIRVGLNPGEPGCSPNILVIISDDGPAMARALVNHRPVIFRPQYAGAARGSAALERFQNTPAVVRWWHVGIRVTKDEGMVAVKLPGGHPPPVRQDASRLTTNFREDIRRAFIIVDLKQAAGLTFQQLGDYIAMVALAQIDPEAETASYDTILNLFDSAPDVPGVTDWDIAYLTSLYDAEFNRRYAIQQRGEVASLMFRDLRAAEAGDAGE